MRRFWDIEYPVGDANRGAAFGERCDPATLSTVALYSSIAGGVAGVGSALGVFGGKGGSAPPPPPPPPQAPPMMNSPQIGAAGDEQARRARAAGGIMSTVATSPFGVPGPASTTSGTKTLLGQ